MAVPLIVADTVNAPAVVELTDPLATPLAFVTAAGWVTFAPPVAASVTVAPLIGLPLASFAVTVIVEVAPGATDVGEAVTVDRAAETVAGVTVTVAVCVMVVPSIWAVTVLVPRSVDEIVPVARPLASVVAEGCVSVLPVPVTESTTVAPLIGLPLASFAVTVMVDVPLPTSMDVGAAATVDREGDTGDGGGGGGGTDAPALISTPNTAAPTDEPQLALTIG